MMRTLASPMKVLSDCNMTHLKKLLIFVPEITPRIKYTFEFIFHTILGVEVGYTTRQNEFLQSLLPKINYSSASFSSALFMKAHSLLFEKSISKQEIIEIDYLQLRMFFPSSDDSFLPFDPFACIFYLLTRYEEYLSETSDNHERFSDSENILAKLGLHQKPVVDELAFVIAEIISKQFPDFKIRKRSFQFRTTIDIDNAWAFKNKSLTVSLGAVLKAAVHGQFGELKQRFAVSLGLQNDPYDTYKYIFETYEGLPDHLYFFFLIGNRDSYDKNISHKNKAFRKLIAYISTKYEVGIHPSYASNHKPWKFEKEKERLEDIIQKTVFQSRQHFLKLRFPHTYQNLLKSGITDDYTMGFASLAGFRAGTCTVFPFFDLSRNRNTELMIHPFQVMDVTLKNYLHLNPEKAWQLISEIMQEVKKVNGTFISLWHNESLNNSGQWPGWQKVFTQMTETGLNFENEQS
jgi:hypothetical protein